ncbi:MAG: hypothetical protein RLZ70_648 [Verrucomicrobiota bacterium]
MGGLDFKTDFNKDDRPLQCCPLQCSITAAASVSYEHNNREVRPDRPRPSRGNVPPTLIQEILELQSEPAQAGDLLKRG